MKVAPYRQRPWDTIGVLLRDPDGTLAQEMKEAKSRGRELFIIRPDNIRMKLADEIIRKMESANPT